MDSRYPNDWDERRRDVYRRDGYICQHCGAGGGRKGYSELHAHHIVPISQGGSHDKSNLVTLCAECHQKVHPDKNISKYNEYNPSSMTNSSKDLAEFSKNYPSTSTNTSNTKHDSSTFQSDNPLGPKSQEEKTSTQKSTKIQAKNPNYTDQNIARSIAYIIVMLSLLFFIWYILSLVFIGIPLLIVDVLMKILLDVLIPPQYILLFCIIPAVHYVRSMLRDA